MSNERGTPASTPEGEAVATYRVFGSAIRSYFPLPELPVARGAKPRLTVRKVRYGQLDLAGFSTRHDWQTDWGAAVCRCARRGDEYLLSFPGQAGFHIAPGVVISCLPDAGVEDRQLRQLLLGQVVPRFLVHSGELLLHASAVTLPGGATVAFLGESGQGKSTLAAYCYQRGGEVIDDDCIHLQFQGPHLAVTGGVPTIRLHPDSRRALNPDTAGSGASTDYSGKYQVRLPAVCGSAARILDGLVLLAPPGEGADDDGVGIVPATGQQAMMAMLRSAFILDPSDSDTQARIFEQVGGALKHGAGLRVQRLHYPRAYDRLEVVLEALMNHFGV